MNYEKQNDSDTKSEKPLINSDNDKKAEFYYDNSYLPEDTECGCGPFKGPLLQKFANKKAYVFLYGFLGCAFSVSFSYANGTITSLEKRFKLSSKSIGLLWIGSDISSICLATFLTYYGGKGHRPRWLTLGVYSYVLCCILSALPHFLWGAGEDALSLTVEGGGYLDYNASQAVIEKENMKLLCSPNKPEQHCVSEDGNTAAWYLMFFGNFIAGIGSTLYFSIGATYMDDNIKKSKTPALISLSYFLRLIGPAFGYTLASYCLDVYVEPSLTPTITNKDPRWIGGWWIGWLAIAIILFVFGSLMACFPKVLPRAAIRKSIERQKSKLSGSEKESEKETASLKDMVITIKRLIKNPTYMCNTWASVFYFFGFMPFYIYLPKYIEVQYRQSASMASMVTGTTGLVCSAVGVLVAGLAISKWKPRARLLAGWNVFVGTVSVAGILAYTFMGCYENDNQTKLLAESSLERSFCNEDCGCDYVKYAPVCSDDGRTFISACHAGCRKMQILPNKTKIFRDCICTISNASLSFPFHETFNESFTLNEVTGFSAKQGPCFVDCQTQFIFFLVVVCVIQFMSAAGKASNFIVGMRCVEEKDKSVSMGIAITVLSLLSFLPSPILFGYIMDKTCTIWGKTCSGKGNCWLYDTQNQRYLLNFTSSAFVLVGTVLDAGVWYYVKNLKIFDDDDNEQVDLKKDSTLRLTEKNNTHNIIKQPQSVITNSET